MAHLDHTGVSGETGCVRNRAARLLALTFALSLCGCAKSVAEWNEELADPDPFTRQLAALSALELDPAASPHALPVLLSIFDDSDRALRAPAERVLARAAPHFVAELLDRFTRDDDASPEWRKAVASGIVAAGPLAVAPLIERMRSPGKSNARELGLLLVRIGWPAIEALRAELRAAPEPNERALAALLLGRMGVKARSASADLERALASDVPLVARLAAESLAEIDPRGELALDELAVASNHGDPGVRTSARRALARIHLARQVVDLRELLRLGADAWPACIAALAGTERVAQHAAFSALANSAWIGQTSSASGDPRANLRHDLALERGTAALELGARGVREQRSLPALFDAAHDSDAGVRWCAALAIASITRAAVFAALRSARHSGAGH
jgi:hypothetical protein